MPNIQQGVNALIGTAAIAARLDPNLERNQELAKLEKQEEVLKQQREAGGDSMREEVKDEISTKLADIAHRRFELDPTEESYKKYAKYMPTVSKVEPEEAHEEALKEIPDQARRAAEYDFEYNQAYKTEFANLEKQRQASGSVNRQVEAKKAQKKTIRVYLASQYDKMNKGENNGSK